MTNSKLHSAIEGARDTLPLVFAAIPFGIVYGALAHAQGLPNWVILAISMLVFAGSAQFIAIILVSSGATLPVIVLTVFVVNLRHLLYAVSLIPYVKKFSQSLRLPMAFTLTDETFAVVYNQATRDNPTPHFAHYYLGSAAFMYLNWQLCTWIGLVAGNRFPELTSFGLDIAMVVAFIGIVVPHLKMPSHWACALVAALSGTLTYDWPNQSGLLFSAVIAIISGVMLENAFNKKIITKKEIS
ncbi:MAG: AzlC family ABC transporter permease [Gammaproteobacteria bacterium]|nr:AzlC family ABC transporter permease [Gammaproteobacteria bacterium]